MRYPGGLSRLIARAAYVGYALPGVVVALSFVFLGARSLNVLNDLLGLDGYRSFALLIAAYVERFLAQAIGPARAALLQVNPHLEESGLLLGRGRARVFATVTLPLMRSGVVAGVALVFLTVMKELPVTLLLAPVAMIRWRRASGRPVARRSTRGRRRRRWCWWHYLRLSDVRWSLMTESFAVECCGLRKSFGGVRA